MRIFTQFRVLNFIALRVLPPNRSHLLIFKTGARGTSFINIRSKNKKLKTILSICTVKLGKNEKKTDIHISLMIDLYRDDWNFYCKWAR